MSDRISIRGGTFAGHTATVVSQGEGTVEIEVVVAVERDQVEFPAHVVPRLRQEIVNAFERWRDDEYLTYFTDSLDWDGYTAHVAAVDAQAEARQTAVLDQFDRETAAWSADRVAHAQRNQDAALEPYLPAPVFAEGYGDGLQETGSWFLDSIFGITPSAERDHARRQRRVASDAAFERDYTTWREAHPAPTAQARAAAEERVARRRPAVEERVARDWGFTLPDGIFRFEVLRELAGDVLRDELDVTPAGILDIVANPAWQPADGAEVRMHGRYHRDPPEFLTFLRHDDGRHWGLWFADGKTSTGVGHYGPDSRFIDVPTGTPIQALRYRLEEVHRDLDDSLYNDDYTWDPEFAEGLFVVRALRELLTTFETGDRPETGWKYLDAHPAPTFPPDHLAWTPDGAGAQVDDDQRHKPADRSYQESGEALLRRVEDARRRCADGHPTAALVLGRGLHWTGAGDSERKRLAHDLLVSAYRALGRDSLAEIADIHYRERTSPS